MLNRNALSITPSSPIEVGLVPRGTARIGNDGSVRLEPQEGSEWVELPTEHYLRGAWDLDLDSERNVLDFVSSWGLPTSDGQALLLSDLRERLQRVRNMVWCWDLLTDGSTLEELATHWSGADEVPHTAKGAARYLEALTEALSDHSPIVAALRPAELRTNLYAGLCAQLFNHLVEGKGYLRCADPKCGRMFVRHLNRAGKPGPEKKTVRFCSQQCQDRYFNEEYRRRQRVAKLRNKGLTPDEIASEMGASLEDVRRWLNSLEELG